MLIKNRDRLVNFFRGLRIGTKILAGYMVALALAAIVGILAINQLDQVDTTVSRLTGHLAQERDLAEETSAQIHLIRLYADQYISHGQTQADLDNYSQAIKDAQGLLGEADQIITEKGRADLQAQTRENFNRFASAFAEIVQLSNQRQGLVTNILDPQGKSSVEKLALLRDNSFESLDFTSANYASQARDTFSQMQVGAIQYMATGNEQYASQVDSAYQSILSTFDLLKVSVRDDNSRRSVVEISTTARAYYDGFQQVHTLLARQQDLVANQLDVAGRAVDQLSNDITTDITEEFAAQSQATNVLVAQTRVVILLTMGLIVAIGFLFGLVLSHNITKPIEEVARAAQGIAAGAFDQKVQVRNRDEVGILADAFNFMTTRVRETLAALNQSLISLRASEARYRGFFEDSPIALWEEDCSLLKNHLDTLRSEGVTNWPEYFDKHPEEVRACAAMVIITDVNRAAFLMHKFKRREDMLGSLPQMFVEKSYDSFVYDLIALATGETQFDKETVHQTTSGEEILIQLRFSIFPGYENTWSKILVSLIDITERKRAEQELARQFEHLSTLSIIDQAIMTSNDLSVTLNVFVEKVIQQLHVDAADILLFEASDQTLKFSAGLGLGTDFPANTRLQLGEGLAGKVALERKLVYESNLADLKDYAVLLSPFLAAGFRSYYGIPLVAKGQLLGVLEIFHRSGFNPTEDWLNFLETMAGQAAIAIDNAILFRNLQSSTTKLEQAYDTTLEGWAKALELRDKETEGHSRRVTELTMMIARALDLPHDELVNIRRGALLHDIGKMAIPDEILRKEGSLTDAEKEIVARHPLIAYELLSPIPYLEHALEIPYCHHEHFDGSGYPRGLKGSQIPLSARVFVIADVWDALLSDRPYRKAWSRKKTIQYMKSQAGAYFDPEILQLFFKLLELGQI